MAVRTTFVAVPALRRVAPAITSGPVTTSITTSATGAVSSRAAHASKMVAARRKRAYSSALRMNGVAAEVVTQQTTSDGPTAIRRIRPSASRALSSAPSTARVSAPGPPAITAATRDGGRPKVGTHSAASIVPRRPEVPAPTYTRRRAGGEGGGPHKSARAGGGGGGGE